MCGVTVTNAVRVVCVVTSIVVYAVALSAMVAGLAGIWSMAAIAMGALFTFVLSIALHWHDPTAPVREQARNIAQFANKLNVLVDRLCGTEHENGFDDGKKQTIKAAVVCIAANPSTSLDQFAGIVDGLLANGNRAVVDATLALLQNMISTAEWDVRVCEFVMGCLKKNHYRVADRKALLRVLGTVVGAYGHCSKKEAEQLHKRVLDILFSEVTAANNAEQKRVAARLVVDTIPDGGHVKMRKNFEVGNFDGVDVDLRVGELVNFLGRESMTLSQFNAEFDSSVRAGKVYAITHAEDFDAAYRLLHEEDNKVLVGARGFQQWAYTPDLMRKKVEALRAEDAAAVEGYFTGDNTKKPGKALVRNVLRRGGKGTVKRLFEILRKVQAGRGDALRGVYTLGFIERMPYVYRGELARSVGYTEPEIRAMKKDWRADDAARMGGAGALDLDLWLGRGRRV
ncbi:MAG: hypothetical protein LBB26_00615 [Puniceicoccales bacterium]|nr:hypothetical protein [Puniceicoccales bacterium]